MLEVIVIGLTLYSLHLTIIFIQILCKISKEANKNIHVEDLPMSIRPTEDDLVYLEYCYENWENIELIELDSLGRMSFIYRVVIRTPDNKYFQTYANGDEESVDDYFHDLDWEEVELKEVIVKQWVPK